MEFFFFSQEDWRGAEMKGGGEHRRHRHTHEGMRMEDIRGAVAKAIIPNIPHVMSGNP